MMANPKTTIKPNSPCNRFRSRVPIIVFLLVVASIGLGWIGQIVPLAAAQRSAQPTGRWVGQRGHDRVGPSSKVAPSGVQDIEILLDRLPPRATIKTATIRGQGGDEWVYNGRYGPWAADLVRSSDGRQALLFLEPTRDETGRSFQIELEFQGGQSTSFYVNGGRASKNLRMPEAQLQANWAGLDGSDHTGPSPAVGPDGFQDARIDLNRLMTDHDVTAVNLQAPDGTRWAYGTNPNGFWNARLVRTAEDRARARSAPPACRFRARPAPPTALR